jgi:hypothetical protein
VKLTDIVGRGAELGARMLERHRATGDAQKIGNHPMRGQPAVI